MSFQNLAIVDVVDEATINTSLEDEFKNIKFIYRQCSVTDEAELRKCMVQIKDEFEWVDLVINSAGVIDEINPKRTIDINYVRISFSYNFVGSFIGL